MAFRWIEVVAERDRMDAVRSAAEEAGVSEMLDGPDPGDGRASLRLLAGEIDRQALLDDIQGMLGQGGNWRIVLTDTEAVIPHTEAEKELEAEREARRVQNSRASSREEVYNNVARGARLDIDYLVLVALSTVVAGIGLATDSAAVVIGAMVIAPLLGPNLALSLAIAIGDRGLAATAITTAAAGLAVALAVAALVPMAFHVDLHHGELGARTEVGYDSVALALASGAAAALSITTGLSATLVGVMVAVALLPPVATLSIALALLDLGAAAGAALLLAVNLVSVNLSALAVFLLKGVRPRTWIEQWSAQQSTRLTLWTLGGALVLLSGLIALAHRFGL